MGGVSDATGGKVNSAGHQGRSRDTGIGPFPRLVLRNLTVVDGTGGPPYGPADIVIEQSRIAIVHLVGSPTGPRLQPSDRPQAGPGGHEIDLTGHYALPGFVDAHGHIGWPGHVPNAQYVYDLWLAHGITSIREPGCFLNGLDFVRSEARRSKDNEIAAPRISPYVAFGEGHPAPFTSPDEGRAWVNEVAERGAEGIKFFGYRRDIYQACLEEAGRLALGSACHHHQGWAAQATALDSARWGLSSVEHFYGLPEAMYGDKQLHPYALDYDYQNEAVRFAESGTAWLRTAEPGSRRWDDTIDELLSTGVVLDPTFNVYDGLRDSARIQNLEWHREYTSPLLWAYWQPTSDAHGSFFTDWGTEHEIAWRANFVRWMQFVKDFFDRGGHVTAGTDPGSIFSLFGFDMASEMTLLREAGLHPLEIIRSATLWGAELLGTADEVGSIEAGKRADLAIFAENPLANLKTVYGHGRQQVRDDHSVARVGGVRYTVKDGIVYDAPALLRRVRDVVAEEREQSGAAG